MSRQTAFPGIIVESIEAKTSGAGRTLEFEEGLPENISMERIKSFTDQLPMFGSDMTRSRLKYNLHVAAVSETAARGKARGFVRAKNPFETSMVSVDRSSKLKDIGVLGPGRSAYSVSVSVSK